MQDLKLKKLIIFVLLFFPVLLFAQDDGQNPDPFDDTPPDFVPPAPIDTYMVPMLIIAIVVAFYFLYFKKGFISKAHQ